MDKHTFEQGGQEEPLVAELIKLNKPYLIEEARKVRVNTIVFEETETSDDKIPVGATKTGGHPDLPPDIPYPVMKPFVKDVYGKEEVSANRFRLVKKKFKLASGKILKT